MPKFHLLRHDTTRYLAHASWHRKMSWLAVPRLSCRDVTWRAKWNLG